MDAVCAKVDAANKLDDPLASFPVFKKYDRNGLNLQIECKRVSTLNSSTVDWAYELTKTNMQALYEQSEWGWKEREKKEEMMDERAWYLLVRDIDSAPIAFSHFRFDVECGEEVLYCYEVQLESKMRRKGLGKFLIQILQLIANSTQMKKVMLTVFKHNHGAYQFFREALQFEIDENSPDFVIAVGPNAAGFLSACVLNSGNWVAVGSVSLWNERSKDSSRQPGCVIYRQRDFPKVLICQCTCYLAEDQLFQWTEKVFACIQQRGLNVMVLSDCSMAEYKTPDSLFSSGTPFLRALKTSRYGSQPACLLLEQPNIVTGLAAAVLSHCQVRRIPAVLYQCYSDIINPDSVTMETYKPALSCLSKLIKLDTSLSTDILRKLVPVNEAQSNLYT